MVKEKIESERQNTLTAKKKERKEIQLTSQTKNITKEELVEILETVKDPEVPVLSY